MKHAPDNPVLTLRMNEPETARFWRLMDAVKSRNPYAGKSDVVRELLGLTPPTLLNAAEITFFRTGEKAPGTLATKPGILATEITLGKQEKRKAG